VLAYPSRPSNKSVGAYKARTDEHTRYFLQLAFMLYTISFSVRFLLVSVDHGYPAFPRKTGSCKVRNPCTNALRFPASHVLSLQMIVFPESFSLETRFSSDHNAGMERLHPSDRLIKNVGSAVQTLHYCLSALFSNAQGDKRRDG
jgi:hypothetical protein